MRITQHGDALVLLTRLPRLFPVNCYLVREDDGGTRIDTALPGNQTGIFRRRSSAQRGVDGTPRNACT
jgi:hypothetical protein